MPPHLIILPGLDGTTRLLAPLIDALRPAFASVRAITYPHDAPMDYTALEAFARPRLPRDEPFVLLGESFSGPVAIAIAADPPPNLIGLVLSTTFARAPVPLISSLAPLTRFAPVRSLPVAALSLALLGRWSTLALRRDLRAALNEVAPAVLRARAACAMRANVIDKLAHIAVPTLCIRARHDRLLRPRAGRELLAGIRDACEYAIDGPHLLLQTRVEDCANRIAAFASTLATHTHAARSPQSTRRSIDQ
jgi:pimeloyl-[acyl-carrier protein] methyl ester esterase